VCLQNAGSSRGVDSSTRCQFPTISGRLSDDSGGFRNFVSEHSTGIDAPAERGFYGQLEEVLPTSHSVYSVSRDEDRYASGKGLSARGSCLGFDSGRQSLRGSQVVAGQCVSKNVRSDGGFIGSGSSCSFQNEATSDVFSVPMEVDYSSSQPFDHGTHVADSSSPVLEVSAVPRTRGSFDTFASSGDSHDRCVQHRLGRSRELIEGPGCLVPDSVSVTHKLSGDASCSFITEGVHSCRSKQVSVDKDRQHSGQTVHQQGRRYGLFGSLWPDSPPSRVVLFSQDFSDSGTRSRSPKHTGRYPIKKSSKSNRMVNQVVSGSNVVSSFGRTTDRPVRNPRKQADSGLLQLVVRRAGTPLRRIIHVLEGSKGLRISSSGNVAEGGVEGEGGSGGYTFVDRPHVAQQALVPIDSPLVGRRPNSVASGSGFVDPAEGQTVTSQPGRLVPGCMAHKRQALVASGLSEQVARTILAARSQSTYKAYECSWRHFRTWCRRKGFDPLTSSVAVILRFLQYCLKTRGLSHSTIRNRLHAIALFHVRFPLKALSHHPWVTAFIKGAQRLCPRVRDILPVWDLQLVLSALREPPFEPMLSTRLDWLTWKLAFLVAVTTAKRIGEIQAFSVDSRYLTCSAAGVRLALNPVFIPKVNTQANRQAEVFLEPFHPRLDSDSVCTLYRLCPCRAIRMYIEATAIFRQTDQLFVCYGSGPSRGKAASKTTISRWVRCCISEAYKAKGKNPPKGTKAHQVRGQAASWAQFNKTPMCDILKSATWSSACTFASFYQLNLAGNSGTARFGTNVLETVLARHAN